MNRLNLHYIALLTVTVLNIGGLNAQNTRISDQNSIGWYNYFGTVKLSGKLGVHSEYQFRREDFGAHWQQSLLRVGLNYQPNPSILLRVGYGWIETFSYGDIAINKFGKQFSEHRIFQMATINSKVSLVEISHRFMLEQRFVGAYSVSTLTKEDSYPMLNRLRYMCRLQMPLKGDQIGDKTPYLAAFDELFMGFGKNVNENIFDQNRVSVLFGYKQNSFFRVEAGFLNQIVQLGREVTGRNVFQYNNGVIVNTYFTFDASKKNE